LLNFAKIHMTMNIPSTVKIEKPKKESTINSIHENKNFETSRTILMNMIGTAKIILEKSNCCFCTTNQLDILI
jgi:hypothetical protein